MREEWRDIPGYEGRYQASNLGRIRGVVSGKVKAQVNIKGGYLGVGIKGGDHKTFVKAVHRLVAAAFFGESSLEVNHKDCDHTNNRIDNLEYVTQRDNYLHAVRMGVCEQPKPVLRSDGESYESVTQAARCSGFDKRDIQNVLRGRQKTTHGYEFAYA